MPRALPGIVGVLLTIAVVVPAPLASAQILARFRGQQPQVRKGRYELNTLMTEVQQRLEEMKVELALLGDIATFPYDLSAHADGNTFKLRGSVPNEMVRQRAIDVARRNSFLRGIDELKIQPNLSVRSVLRHPRVLQQEGTELLRTGLGESAAQMSLEARPNGAIVLTGSIDSVQSKLEISRLFRRLPGCTAVINELTIEQIVRDGQRTGRVMHNGSPPTPPPAPAREPVPFTPVRPQPAPSPSSSLDARKDELRLSTALSAKQPSTPHKPTVEKIGSGWEAFAPSNLPVKWGRPTESLKAQANHLEPEHAPPPPAAPQMTHQQVQAPPQPLPKPADFAWGSPSARPQAKLPPLDPVLSRPAQTTWIQSFSAPSRRSQANNKPRPKVVETHAAPEPALAWRDTGGNEESEPKTAPPATEPPAPAYDPVDSSPAASPQQRSLRRWPSAYVTGPPPNRGHPGVMVFDDGHPGVIAFDDGHVGVIAFDDGSPSADDGHAGVIAFDDDPASLKTAPAVIATSRSLEPRDLQRQIRSICGRQAHHVSASMQRDGTVLVRVKVANRSIEDQLSRKILALPDMNSPRVRLLMEIEP